MKNYLNKSEDELIYSFKNKNLKFYDLIDFYFMNLKNRIKESSFYSAYNRINKYVRLLPNIDVSEIDYSILIFWWNRLKCSSYVKKRIKSDLKGIFEFLDLYYGLHNVEYKKLYVPKDYSIKKIKKKKYFLSISDFKRFYDCLNEERFKLLFLTAFVCALRIGETRGITIDAVDFNSHELYIYQQVVEIGKGKFEVTSVKSDNSNRSILLPDFLFKRLFIYIKKNKLHKDNFLFCSKRSKDIPIGSSTINRMMRKCIKEANLNKFTFHAFRRSEASFLLENGLSQESIKDYLGHDSFEVTKRYYIGDSEEKKAKICAILDDKLSSIF